MARDAVREAKWLKRLARVGEFLEAVGEGRGVTGVPGGTITSLKIRMPTPNEPELLLVVQATGEEGAVVAFVGALGICEAVLTWRAKDGAKGLKWRESKPWGERK